MKSQLQANSMKMDKLGYKPNIKDLEMASDDDDEDGGIYGDEVGDEEGEDDSASQSDIEDDMQKGGRKRQMPKEQVGSSDDDSDAGRGGGVYKAPKLTSVAYEDKADRKKRMKADYEKRRLGKSNLVDELQREMRDEPEEVYMGGAFGRKGKAARYEEALEN